MSSPAINIANTTGSGYDIPEIKLAPATIKKAILMNLRDEMFLVFKLRTKLYGGYPMTCL